MTVLPVTTLSAKIETAGHFINEEMFQKNTCTMYLLVSDNYVCCVHKYVFTTKLHAHGNNKTYCFVANRYAAAIYDIYLDPGGMDKGNKYLDQSLIC